VAGRFTKGSLTISMIVGTVLVPLTALAAIWLTGPGDSGEESVATTTTVVPAITVVPAPETTTSGVTQDDLQAACGPEGMQLVALEEQGSISDVQQAALDALRDLCDQQGLPLPAKPASEPMVQTVIVPAVSSPTSVATTPATTYDDHEEDDDHDDDEDDREDDDHEDDDHEDDDHEDDDHEDDDHEDDD
jgi:hypothetical protein